MADFRAIAATCEAVIFLLRSTYRFEDFDTDLEFRVYAADNFTQPMNSGVSLFLYRILPNGTHRTPAGRLESNGRRYQTQLPVDLHFLLTAWGGTAALQQTIAGWMMRVLEDTPTLPSGLLNVALPEVFRADETVEIHLAELVTEDMLRIWELLPQSTVRLSVPYVARYVRIESTQLKTAGPPVQERVFDYRKAG